MRDPNRRVSEDDNEERRIEGALGEMSRKGDTRGGRYKATSRRQRRTGWGRGMERRGVEEAKKDE